MSTVLGAVSSVSARDGSDEMSALIFSHRFLTSMSFSVPGFFISLKDGSSVIRLLLALPSIDRAIKVQIDVRDKYKPIGPSTRFQVSPSPLSKSISQASPLKYLSIHKAAQRSFCNEAELVQDSSVHLLDSSMAAEDRGLHFVFTVVSDPSSSLMEVASITPTFLPSNKDKEYWFNIKVPSFTSLNKACSSEATSSLFSKKLLLGLLSMNITLFCSLVVKLTCFPLLAFRMLDAEDVRPGLQRDADGLLL